MIRTKMFFSSEYSEHSLCSFDLDLHGLLARPYETTTNELSGCSQ